MQKISLISQRFTEILTFKHFDRATFCYTCYTKIILEEAGAELGQAQLKLELGFTSNRIFCYILLNTVRMCKELTLLSSIPPPCHASLTQVTQNDHLTIYLISTDHLWSISSRISSFPRGGRWVGGGGW